MQHRILTTEEMAAMTGYDVRTLRETMCDDNASDALERGRHYSQRPGGRRILFDWTVIAADMGLPDDQQSPGDLLRSDEAAALTRYDVRTLRETLVDRTFKKGTHYFLLPAKRARTMLFLRSSVLAAMGLGQAPVTFAQPGQPVSSPSGPTSRATEFSASPAFSFTPTATDFWAQAAQSYIEALPAHLRPGSRAELTTAVERDLSPFFADRTVSEITLPDVTNALEVITSDRGRRVAIVAFNVLHGVFEQARILWGVPSPIRHLQRIPLPDKQPRVLRIHEIVRLLALAPDHFRPYFVTRIFTGISDDEAHSLRGRSILLDCDQIRIEEVRVGSAWEPLDETRRRTINLPLIVKEALIHQRTALSCRNSDDLVFTDLQGRPLKTAWVSSKVFEPLLHAAGIRPMQLRELRHTAPFLWLCANESPHDVADWCGYGADASALLLRYQRVAFKGDGYTNLDRLLAAATSDEERQQLRMPLTQHGLHAAVPVTA